MGWSIQGYNAKKRKWEVWGNSYNEKIQYFDNKTYEFNFNPIRVMHGFSDYQFFYGYLKALDEKDAKERLSVFNGNLVYQTKYGEESYEFDSSKLFFIKTEHLYFFTEQRIFYDFEWSNLISQIDYALIADIDNIEIQNEIRNLENPFDFNLELDRIVKLVINKLDYGVSKEEIARKLFKPVKRNDFIEKVIWTLKYIEKIKW